jgi:histone H3/H4
MGDLLVVQSKVKEAAKKFGGKDLRFSGDAVATLSAKVEGLLKDAAKRAKDNGRKTVKPQDI